MMMGAADVVGLSWFEVLCDSRSGADGVGEKGRGAVMTTKDRVRMASERAIEKAAVDRAIRTVILAWTVSVEETDDHRLCLVLDRRVSHLHFVDPFCHGVVVHLFDLVLIHDRLSHELPPVAIDF